MINELKCFPNWLSLDSFIQLTPYLLNVLVFYQILLKHSQWYHKHIKEKSPINIEQFHGFRQILDRVSCLCVFTLLLSKHVGSCFLPVYLFLICSWCNNSSLPGYQNAEVSFTLFPMICTNPIHKFLIGWCSLAVLAFWLEFPR